MNKIFIVIPVHNRKKFTRKCLLSLREQTYKNFKIVIVDDGSRDGTTEMLSDEFPEVKVIRGPGDWWWTKSINMGIIWSLKRTYPEDYILTLNDDLVVNRKYLENLTNAANKNPNSIIGSVEVSLDNPKIIISGGVLVDKLSAKMNIINKGRELSDFSKDHLQEVNILPGRGVLYPEWIFREIGLFDDKNFHQCGDMELPLRCKLQGVKLYVSYSSIVKSFKPTNKENNINSKSKYKITDFKEYFFGIRSNFRLKYRWHQSQSISKNKITCFLFFLFDLLRISKHFFSNLSIIK